MLHEGAITSKRNESHAVQRMWISFLMNDGHKDFAEQRRHEKRDRSRKDKEFMDEQSRYSYALTFQHQKKT